MADKSNTISKKTIIAIAIVIVLLFIAGLSVGIFLADKGRTEAVDGNQSIGESQTTEENKNSDENKANGDQNANENKTGENNVVDNNENNQVTENNTVDNNKNNQVTGNNTVANNENNQVTENNSDNANGVTTNTNINEVGETTITRVEEQEKLVSRDFWDWWTPSTVVASGSAVAERLIPQTPDFTVEKTATTGVGEDKLVYANKNITYTIKVTNNGEQELKNIEIADKIPEQTTFVSIDDAQNSGTTILENDTVIGLKWIVTVPAKESIEVKFTVKVNENATGTISNAAIVNGKESNEEKTSIINAKKSSKIIERNNVEVKDGLEVAKLGDKIKYTITATNTGDVSGKTTIEDTVPVGTELIESSVTDNGKITTTTDNRKQISWNVELGANESIERTFIVEVKDISGKIENVATVGGVPTNPDKKDTADIKVVKEVTDIKRNQESLGKDVKVQAGDVIEYKIKVTNTGSLDLTNVVLDEKLVGININAKDLKIGDLKAGDSKEISATYTVTYEKDIKGKADENGNPLPIINEVFVKGESVPTKPDQKSEEVSDDSKVETPVEEAPSYDISKIADKEKVTTAGEVITYTITVTNTGNTTLKDIAVKDDMAGIDETISEIPVGESRSVTGTYTVTQNDIDNKTEIKNVATAGDKSPEIDVPVEKQPDILVNKDATAVKAKDAEGFTDITETTKVRPDDVIEYTIVVTNTGNTTLEDIKITDSLNVKYDDKDVNAGNTVYTIESLEPGKYVEIKVYYTVTAEDVKTEGTINNVATATAKDGTHDDDNDNKVVKNPNTQVTATKAWENMDSDAAKANTLTSIKLQVKNGDTVVAEQEVTEKDNWTYTFRNLPVYDANGNKITYTIDEAVVSAKDQAKLDLYEKSIKNGVITNTFKPERVTEKTDVTMTKVWEDNNNTFNTRPDSIILTVNGIDYEVTGTKKADSWSRTENLPKYDAEGREISYTATEKTVPTGYEKVSEEGLTVTNRANELISKTAYKVDANGNIGSPATNKDTFAANETVYYKITLTNAGSEPISKTVTDEIPLRLTLNTVDGKTGESGTTDKGDNWTVTKNDKKQSVVTWEVTNLAAREARELIIKATVVAEAEYKDICNKTIDGITANTAKLFVRKDGKVPYEGSGTGYDASLYTGELGTVYLNSSDLHYDTNANLKNDDLYYLIKNNNIITDMVAKGITRTQLVDALKTNGTTLADDEVVVWYVIKNESDGYHIDGVIRKISSLTEITNTAFTDKVSSDSTIKLEDIEIGQRGSITVKSITSSTDTVSTPMDVVFVLDTSGSMTYPLKGKNETAVENSRAKAMVNAVNSSIKTIMSKNKESRVGVVGFSGDASTIIPLGNYAQNIDYLTREYSAGGLMYSSSQTIKSNVGNKLSRQVTGGTNTQSGIKLGAEMLTSNQNTTTATVILKDGTTKTITRTPLLILVTDGKPTYYYDNATATGKVNGYGYTNETNENYYYWTLRTAKYYKDQITNKYYPKNTDKTAKVFTIGIGLKGNEAVAMLDPTEKNVNACNNNNSQQKALYKLITDNGKIAPGAYSYATGSKTGEITESDLTGFLNTSIDSSTDNEKNRAITTEESKARRVELGTINEEKEFSLTVGTDSYTSLKAAMKAGYVKKATSTTYYLDLSEISRSTNVEIVYWN